MMKSAIVCEGGTDQTLIQYYMEKVHQWNYLKASQKPFFTKVFKREESEILEIVETGGVSKIAQGFQKLLDITYKSISIQDQYQRIVLITDHDEASTISDFGGVLGGVLEKYSHCKVQLENNCWTSVEFSNIIGEITKIDILLLVIPFEEKGALVTFLLNAVGEKNSYDKKIIDDCSNFVENIDPDKNYLKKRRHITKAKFDVYFSIRTPMEQFKERRNILRDVKWEEYVMIQETFQELEKL